MIIPNNSTDVTTYFKLKDSTNHALKADITVTDIELCYVKELAAISTKVDATALAAATSAHADNKIFNVGQGVYRIDWPDAAFTGGEGTKTQLIVVCSGVDTEVMEVLLSPAVPVGSSSYVATDVLICSSALMLLGNEPIDNLTDDTKAVDLCVQFYQQTVNAVLRAYTWNCAIAQSAALVASTTPSFGYGYAYTLPADCLRVLSIEDDDSIEFKIINNELQTDEATAKISYIKVVTAANMDSLLKEAISARLAATIAFSLTNSNSAATAMWQLYKDKLDEAQSIDAFEGTPPQMGSNDWINSRR